jgi:hypothetical protein
MISRKRRVAVIGGGIAGMTAAHELLERGFDVTLCEAKSVPGGKARSFPVPGSGVGGRADGVLGNLREVRHVHALGGGAGEVMLLPARAPESLADLSQWLGFFVRNDFGLPVQDRLRFAERMLILLTACEARRFRELEGIDWWRFIGAEGASLKYQRTVAECSRLLVAARPRESSARTFGYVFLQLVLGMLQKGARADRVLCGPTSEVWILPWWEHLRSLGADLHTGARALTISMENGRVDSISIEENGVDFTIKADDYVLALPLEAARGLLTPAILEADPGLARLSKLKTAWMNGIQLYFDRDLRFVHGHTIYLGSPWSLVSIAQAQTWPGVDLSRRGDGSVRDILSVVISEWSAPGVLLRTGSRMGGRTCSRGRSLLAWDERRLAAQHLRRFSPGDRGRLDGPQVKARGDPIAREDQVVEARASRRQAISVGSRQRQDIRIRRAHVRPRVMSDEPRVSSSFGAARDRAPIDPRGGLRP